MTTMDDVLSKNLMPTPPRSSLDPFFQSRRCLCVESSEGLEEVTRKALQHRCDFLIVTRSSQPVRALAIHDFLSLYATATLF